MSKQYRKLSNQLIWAENSTDLCKYIKQFFLKEELTGFPQICVKEFQEYVKKLQRLKLTHTQSEWASI